MYSVLIRTLCGCLSVILLAAPVLATSTPGGDSTLPSSEVRISAQTRVIVVSPHPDDAVLGAGGLIQRVVARHASVEIVEMTSGDAFPKGLVAVRGADALVPAQYRWYGTLREHEVVQAMHDLGVARSRLRLLGFPDEGLCRLADDRSSESVFSSPYTKRDSPPMAEQVVAGAKYRGDDLRSELEMLFLAFRPSLVVLPDPHDEHPDHCATHMLVHEAAELAMRRGLHQPSFLHYLIHYRDWPNTDAVVPRESGAITLHLTAAERATKLHALSVYRSQMVVMSTFMRAFAGSEERFVTADAQPAIPCWCGGENIALGAHVDR